MSDRLTPFTAMLAVVAVIALVLSAMAFQRTAGEDVQLTGMVADEVEDNAGVAATDGQEVAAGGGEVAVELSEFSIDPEPVTIGPDGTLAVTNDGAIEHNLKIEGMEEEYGTENLAGGQEGTLDLTGLEPGEYPVYCDVQGHAESGMTSTLVIDADAAPQTDTASDDETAPSDDDSDVADDAEGVGDDPEDGSNLTGMEKAEWLRANYEAAVGQFPAETEALGSQPMEPEVTDDGTKVFELVLDETEWEVAPGEFVEAVAYNGQVPGPWIQVDVGDQVTLRIVNNLDDEGTTLHPHGIFMHPFEVDGVGMISMEPIMPGDTWEQTFEAKETSVGMYHGHDNGLQQVLNGAFGAFTVGQVPLPEQADNVVAENVMVLNDAGEIGLTLNAKSFPATEPYVLQEGEQMIMHYYNEGLTAHPMHLHNNAQMIIAKDGYPLATPEVRDTINIAPGERYTVVIFAESPGTWVWHCHILSHVEKDDGSVFGMFTALIVEPSDDPDVNADLSRELGRDQIPTFPGQGATAVTPPPEPDA